METTDWNLFSPLPNRFHLLRLTFPSYRNVKNEHGAKQRYYKKQADGMTPQVCP